MSSKPESSIILLIILVAIILAIGVFLFISLLIGRSEAAADTTVPPNGQANTVIVEDQPITLQVDPNLRPVIVPATAVPAPTSESQPEAGQSQEGGQPPAPTAQPAGDQANQQNQQSQQNQGAGGQPAANRLTFIDYVVVPGDTLYRIQEKQTTTIALMAKHGIDASDIGVGNVLRLPVGNSAACNGWRAYVVLKGDTSFGISQRAGISLEEFGARNGLDANYSIYETDIVCIP